jgi:hypothetical protein
MATVLLTHYSNDNLTNTAMFFILKLLVFIAATGWMAMQMIKQVKQPFDDKRLKFSMKKEFWTYYWDDFSIMMFGCILGGLLAHELAIPIINRFMEWPELAESAIDLTSIAVCTIAVGKILEKLSGFKV